jgi:hypothetical protein
LLVIVAAVVVGWLFTSREIQAPIYEALELNLLARVACDVGLAAAFAYIGGRIAPHTAFFIPFLMVAVDWWQFLQEIRTTDATMWPIGLVFRGFWFAGALVGAGLSRARADMVDPDGPEVLS